MLPLLKDPSQFVSLLKLHTSSGSTKQNVYTKDRTLTLTYVRVTPLSYTHTLRRLVSRQGCMRVSVSVAIVSVTKRNSRAAMCFSLSWVSERILLFPNSSRKTSVFSESIDEQNSPQKSVAFLQLLFPECQI